MPEITLYDLAKSRSIRIAWLLEELGLEYNLVHAERNEKGLSGDSFKAQTGTILGKAPVLKDGELIMQESGAIAQYLVENYDRSHSLLPTSPIAARLKTLEFLHAAEGTMMLHALPYLYAKRVNREFADALQPALSRIVVKDMNWLEEELRRKDGGWLVGDSVTVADTTMAFSIQFILTEKLAGDDAGKWARIKKWLDLCQSRDTYQRAVKRTGFEMMPQ